MICDLRMFSWHGQWCIWCFLSPVEWCFFCSSDTQCKWVLLPLQPSVRLRPALNRCCVFWGSITRIVGYLSIFCNWRVTNEFICCTRQASINSNCRLVQNQIGNKKIIHTNVNDHQASPSVCHFRHHWWSSEIEDRFIPYISTTFRTDERSLYFQSFIIFVCVFMISFDRSHLSFNIKWAHIKSWLNQHESAFS